MDLFYCVLYWFIVFLWYKNRQKMKDANKVLKNAKEALLHTTFEDFSVWLQEMACASCKIKS